MRYYKLLPLISTALLFLIGCGEDNTKNNQHNSTITINKIEQSITQKDTNLGCDETAHQGDKACTQEKDDAAQFILSTLSKESNNTPTTQLGIIKENLSKSLEEINQQTQQKNRIKEELVAFIETNNPNRGKALQRFIHKVNSNTFETEEERKLGSTTSHNLVNIKEELKNLVSLERSETAPKEVKKKLQDLISNITESKKDLSQTKATLEDLVKKVEQQDSPSAKKFVSAMIEDVSNNKIRIIKEQKHYFIIKVQEGDNLSILAKRYYNDTDKYKLIYQANKDKINSDYQIYPGSTLLIPKL